MFAVRRIFRDNRRLTNYISTTSVIKKDDPNKLVDALNNLENRDPTSKNVEEKKPKNIQNNKKVMKVSKAKPVKEMTKEQEAVKPQNDPFKKLLESSAEEVAKQFKENKTETKRDLLNYIKSFEVTKDYSKSVIQSEYVTGKICPSPENDVARLEKKLVDLGDPALKILKYYRKSLNPFNPEFLEKPKVKLNIWDELEAENLAFLSKQTPRNYFEELIDWTNKGRLWHFPIDNDQGLDEEAKFSFTDHIFLDQHLEPWCPKKGPIRRFMELVLIGLAKNHHYSVEEKIEHIHWFEDYFEKKKKLLIELGALGSTKEIDESKEEKSSGS